MQTLMRPELDEPGQLTQQEIEELTPEEYSCFLAYGEVPFCKALVNEDEAVYEEYLKEYQIFDL